MGKAEASQGGKIMSDTSKLDYGEPWQQNRRFGMAANRHGKCLSQEQEFRAVACVNACAGMADPAKEIAAMREAIRGAHGVIKTVEAFWPVWVGTPDLMIEHNKQKAALAKLQPFTTP